MFEPSALGLSRQLRGVATVSLACRHVLLPLRFHHRIIKCDPQLPFYCCLYHLPSKGIRSRNVQGTAEPGVGKPQRGRYTRMRRVMDP